jgi:hypothetical protein
MEAALLHQADKKKYEKVVYNAMKIIPSLCKKIAGFNPPMEVCLVR